MNKEFEQFSLYGGSLAHSLDQCQYGYAYGILHNGITSHDAHCGITPAMCPDFQCVTVQDLAGQQCLGLEHSYRFVSTPSQCRKKCCDDKSGECEVWLWDNKGRCWTGRSSMCSGNSTYSGAVLAGGRIK